MRCIACASASIGPAPLRSAWKNISPPRARISRRTVTRSSSACSGSKPRATGSTGRSTICGASSNSNKLRELNMRTRATHGAGVLMLIAGFCASAADGDYPVKPIRVIVPFATGGSTDILIRTVGQRMSESLGQQLLIDNRGGAGGALGAEMAAKAPPDGYTIMATTSGVVVANPSLYKKLSYDPIKDFAPVSIIASLPNMLVVPPSMPVKDVRALIALAKARPGQLTYASGGNGTSNHLAGALLNYLAGVEITHVPYKGGGPAVLAVMTGE